MSESTAHPTHLSSSNPNLQVAWDSTSLRTALWCPRKYQYQILEGWRPHKQAVDLEFGIHFHEALEIFDREKYSGKPHDEAALAALHYVLHCGFDSDVKEKDRFTLARSVVWYCEHYRNDPAEIYSFDDGKPAVELSFRLPLDIATPSGDPYLLCGHLDGVVNFAERLLIRERKTTKQTLGERYFEGFSPDIQVSIYTVAGHLTLREQVRNVLIDAMQTAVNFSTFARYETKRTPSYIDEFLRELTIYIKQFERFAEEGFFPKNEANCKMCEFKSICSLDPSNRRNFLKSNFEQKIWNPLQIRS